MRIVIAIDSFKGSMTSLEAGQAAAEGVRRVYPDAQIKILPVADGGEGTVNALVAGLNGSIQTARVQDPLGRIITAEYGILSDGTAVMEMAAAAGLPLLKPNERDPMKTSTYGVGEMILDAIKKGCRKFIIGIGGSATNDGGMGMLKALGFSFLDGQGREATLENLFVIDCKNAVAELSGCSFTVACDVNNPLCGDQGCSAVYGPQKGATPETVKLMDGWLQHYGQLVQSIVPNADPNAPGAGAAGGIGFAFAAFLGGRLIPGVDMILEAVGLEREVLDADVVITGEGRLDGQTVMGKAPVGVAGIAAKYKKTVIAFAGSVTSDAIACNDHGIKAFFPIVRGVCTLEEAMKPENAKVNMAAAVEQVFRLM